jgi:hypothetical protein
MFHDAYERLAPQFGYVTRSDTRTFDASSPNGRLMAAVCGEVVPRILTARLAALEAENAEFRRMVAEWRAKAATFEAENAELRGRLEWLRSIPGNRLYELGMRNPTAPEVVPAPDAPPAGGER